MVGYSAKRNRVLQEVKNNWSKNRHYLFIAGNSSHVR